MSEMVEKVAPAIFETMRHRCMRAAECKEAARAAIEAMREPTKAMLWAHELPHVGPDEIRALWSSMIDAALSKAE